MKSPSETRKAMLLGTLLLAVSLASFLVLRGAGLRRYHLVAVVAHPDDETSIGPLLAHYGARRDVDVHLVVVTNGDKGVQPFAGIPAGPKLAAVRLEEIRCTCKALGILPPVMMGKPDGGLGDFEVELHTAQELGTLFRKLQADVIVTWGPDGGYGHLDHRMVSALVTQVVQEGRTNARLYYVGLPRSRMIPENTGVLRVLPPFSPTPDSNLQVRIAYTEADAARAKEALQCHRSQFTPEGMQQWLEFNRRVGCGAIYLRSWSGGPAASELFPADR